VNGVALPEANASYGNLCLCFFANGSYYSRQKRRVSFRIYQKVINRQRLLAMHRAPINLLIPNLAPLLEKWYSLSHIFNGISYMPTLNWIGKEAVVNHHQQVPFRLLKDVPDLACGDPGSGNLIVQGDNLEALKALLPYYAGQVKCIYIDPPYNTGNEGWAYNDNVNSPLIRDWLGKTVGKEGETLDRHDRWLCMMYPRLALLRQFLRADGAIFVSIDDNEMPLLRLLMSEIFGEHNFIASIIWQKKQSPQSDAINLSDMHDYVVAYALRAKESRQDPKGWDRNLLPRGSIQDARFENPDNDPRGAWTSTDYTCNKNSSERPNLFYPIINPFTNKEIWPSSTRVWAYDPSAHKKNVEENRIWWGSNGKGRPRIKKYISEVADGIVPSTWWTREFAGDNQESRRELRAVFSDTSNNDFWHFMKICGCIQAA
jgi:site-specific DNA-methyltransferase (adenine-specific)/adenine-specific DNA-methyltransferase